MSNDKETRSSPLGLRITPSVKKALQQAAMADHRPLASYVEKLLVEHLKAEGYLRGTAPRGSSPKSIEQQLAKSKHREDQANMAAGVKKRRK